MTLQQALELARSRPGTDELAVWVRETLGESWPCGYEQPEFRKLRPPPHGIVIPESFGGAVVSPDELLAICAGLITYALEAKRDAAR